MSRTPDLRGDGYTLRQTASTLDQIHRLTRQVRKAFSTKDGEDVIPRLWFRGETSGGKKKRTPEPGLLRFTPTGDATADAWRVWAKEAAIRSLLKSRGASILQRQFGFRPSNALEWTFVAQHYGLDSRLLDWSASVSTATFFAVHRQFAYNVSHAGARQLKKEVEDLANALGRTKLTKTERRALEKLRVRGNQEDGALWILEPRRLLDQLMLPDCENIQTAFAASDAIAQEYFLERHEVFPSRDAKLRGKDAPRSPFPIDGSEGEYDTWKQLPRQRRYRKSALKKIKRLIDPQRHPRGPLPIMPTQFLARIVTQDSRFTLHPMRPNMLMYPRRSTKRAAPHPYLRRILIKAHNKERMGDDLRTAGVNTFSIFRDLDHLAPFFDDTAERYFESASAPSC